MFFICSFVIPVIFWYFVHKSIHYKDKDELDNDEEDLF